MGWCGHWARMDINGSSKTFEDEGRTGGKKREKLIMCKSVRKSGEKKKGGWRTEDGDILGKKVVSEGGKTGRVPNFKTLCAL